MERSSSDSVLPMVPEDPQISEETRSVGPFAGCLQQCNGRIQKDYVGLLDSAIAGRHCDFVVSHGSSSGVARDLAKRLDAAIRERTPTTARSSGPGDQRLFRIDLPARLAPAAEAGN